MFTIQLITLPQPATLLQIPPVQVRRINTGRCTMLWWHFVVLGPVAVTSIVPVGPEEMVLRAMHAVLLLDGCVSPGRG